MDDSLAGAHLIDFVDLNELCMTSPASSFLLRVSGDSMIHKGIFDGDVAVCDKSIEAKDGSVIIAMYNGGFTIKELKLAPLRLVAYDVNSTVYEISEGDDFEVFGVVTNVIRSLKK